VTDNRKGRGGQKGPEQNKPVKVPVPPILKMKKRWTQDLSLERIAAAKRSKILGCQSGDWFGVRGRGGRGPREKEAVDPGLGSWNADVQSG